MSLLTYQDVSKKLNVPVGTIYSMVSKRDIPHVRIGPRLVRFSAEDIAQFISVRSIQKAEVQDEVSQLQPIE